MNPRKFARQSRQEEGRDRDLGRRVRALESMRASQIPLDAIEGLPQLDVQTALALLAVIVGANGLVDAVDDAAAAAAGVQLNHFYRTGNAVQVRLV